MLADHVDDLVDASDQEPILLPPAYELGQGVKVMNVRGEPVMNYNKEYMA